MTGNKKIAVIGAGTMGTGLALNLAIFEHEVILIDSDPEALQRAKTKIPGDLRLFRMMNAEKNCPTSAELAARIVFTTEYKDLEAVRLVIENIPEDWNKKETLYRHIRDAFDPDTLFAINTSCIAITRAAACFYRPENVIGTHFMNPVPLKNFVEVITGYHTSQHTVNSIKTFLASFGKKCVVVKDYPGFVSNRLSHLFMNEAAFLLQDQVASPRDIDLIFTEGYGHAMGPLATADLIGLDTVVNSLEVLCNSYQDPKFRCCPLLVKMVQAGMLGRKTGQGFFKYT